MDCGRLMRRYIFSRQQFSSSAKICLSTLCANCLPCHRKSAKACMDENLLAVMAVIATGHNLISHLVSAFNNKSFQHVAGFNTTT